MSQGIDAGAMAARVPIRHVWHSRDFSVEPLGPWSTLLLASLSAPLQAAGLALLRLASRKVSNPQDDEDEDLLECVDWLPRDCRRPTVGLLGFLLLFVGLVLSTLEMLMGAGVHDKSLDTIIVMRKVVLLAQCSQVMMCYLAERVCITCAELPSLQRSTCVAVWLGCTLLEWAAPWAHDDTSQVLGNQMASCDDGFRALFTFVWFPLWATSLCFGVLVLTCLDPSEAGLGEFYDEALEAEDEDLTSDSDDEESEAMRKTERRKVVEQLMEEKRRRHEERQRARERRGYIVREPGVRIFRRVVLPLIYGFAFSASGLLFATGYTTPEWRIWAGMSCTLLLIAACCATDWILRLELSLGVWAPLSQCCATLLRLLQSHLIFRDFRWSYEEGFAFSVGKKPGVYFFLAGVMILLAVSLMYMLTYQWNEWLKSELTPSDGHHSALMRTLTKWDVQAAYTRHMSVGTKEGEDDTMMCEQLFHLLLLPFCFLCYLKGVTSPLYHYSICTPDVQWVNSEAMEEQFRNSTRRSSTQSCMGHAMGFVDSITWLYDNHMPFSAMLAAYRSIIGPPLEFCAILAYTILQPLGLFQIPAPVRAAMRRWLVGGASSKFATNCMVCILYVTIIQSADPGGNSFQAQFTRGFAFMMMYCVSYGALVRSLREEEPYLQEREPSFVDPHERQEHESGSSSSQEEEHAPLQRFCDWWATAKDVLLALFMFAVVICSLFYSITTSFISLDFRYSGIKLMKIQPVLLDLWRTLLKVNLPVAGFAAITMVFLLLLRIFLWLWLRTVFREDPLASLKRDSQKKVSVMCKCSLKCFLEALEAMATQFTLCHIWAESIVLLWLGILTRSRDIYQVCASLPSPPLGLVAIGVLGMGGSFLHSLMPKATMAQPPPSASGPASTSRLPCGGMTWAVGFVVVFMMWATFMNSHGPRRSFSDVTMHAANEMLVGFLPKANKKVTHVLPESKGSCDLLWARFPQKHLECEGRAPLAHMLTPQGWDVTVLWATGLNQVVFTDMVVDQPTWENVERTMQTWSLSVSGVFTHLKVWVKAAKDGEEWINNNICCTKNFSFTVQATTTCAQGKGFDQVKLKMVQMDRPEMESTVTEWNLPGNKGELTVDYGDVESVGSLDLKQVMEDYLTGRIGGGRLLMRTSEGPPLDVLAYLRVRLQDVVSLNTRPHRLCPFHPALPATASPALPSSPRALASSGALPCPPRALASGFPSGTLPGAEAEAMLGDVARDRIYA